MKHKIKIKEVIIRVIVYIPLVVAFLLLIYIIITYTNRTIVKNNDKIIDRFNIYNVCYYENDYELDFDTNIKKHTHVLAFAILDNESGRIVDLDPNVKKHNYDNVYDLTYDLNESEIQQQYRFYFIYQETYLYRNYVPIDLDYEETKNE